MSTLRELRPPAGRVDSGGLPVSVPRGSPAFMAWQTPRNFQPRYRIDISISNTVVELKFNTRAGEERSRDHQFIIQRHSGTSPSHSAHSRRPALESGTSLVSNNDGARSWAPGGSLLLAGGALRCPGGIPWSSRAEVPRPAHTGRVPRGAVGSRHELRERVTPRHATLLLTVYMSCACAARRQPALDYVETELRALFHACRRGLRREHGRGQPLFGANGPGVHTDGYARYVVRHRSGRGRDSGAS